jgi:glyoxylase-like metal-dependent hydrolase (beta-lactamase superfamily II)
VDLRVREAHWNAIQETVVKPPNVTYSDTMTLVKGGREVQLHFVGRGHTGGDTMVFLPQERIVFTGDFFVGSPNANALPYMGDGFVDEWPSSLQALKGLDFDVIVPGHGTPFSDRSQIDDLQAYLRDLWSQAADLRAQGVSAEDAVSRIDLTQHESNYGDRVRNVDPRAIVRIYERLQIQHPM